MKPIEELLRDLVEEMRMTRGYRDEYARRAQSDKRDVAFAQSHLLRTQVNLSLVSTDRTRTLDTRGDVVYIDMESTGLIRVKLGSAWPAAFPMRANTAIKGIPYDKLHLEWDLQPGKVANIWYGWGMDIIPPNNDIASIGEIVAAVPIDYPTLMGRTVVSANGAFLWGLNLPASPGNFNNAQVRNPVGSGKVGYIDAIYLANDNAAVANYGLRQLNTALANLGDAEPKYLDQTDSVMDTNFEQSATAPGVQMLTLTILQSRFMRWPFAVPIRLDEGTGIVLHTEVVNSAMRAAFEFREE